MRLNHLARFFSLIAVCVAGAMAGLRAQEPGALKLSGDCTGAHDPAIGRDGNKYFVFTTGAASDGGQIALRCSDNLTDWRFCGHVFDALPDWIRKATPKTHDLWAPDVSYFGGKFHLYYAYSSFGSNASGIAVATNETLDPASPKYHWKDEGLVLNSTIADDYNAIDPNIVLDEAGHPWLSFGSFWSGIKMRRLDPVTGKLSSADAHIYSLAARQKPDNPGPTKHDLPPDWQAIEAPFIVHHDGYYYLFVSFDLCCRGTHSNYHVVVGRSKAVTGPYLDVAGKAMLDGGGTPLLSANAHWVGPGGESVLQRPEGDVIVFHAYDASTGVPALQISTLVWRNGWPHASLGTAEQAQ